MIQHRAIHISLIPACGLRIALVKIMAKSAFIKIHVLSGKRILTAHYQDEKLIIKLDKFH